MLEITKNTEFTARARQYPDFKEKIPGYDFSYPVLNTIEICNLLITGGSIEIRTERMGKMNWSYNTETATLSVEQKEIKKTYYICNPENLGESMMQYFEEKHQSLCEKNYATNIKKSHSKIGNQNAKKEKDEAVEVLSQKTDDTKQSITNETNMTRDDEYSTDFLNNMPMFIKAVKNNPTQLCDLDEFLKIPGKTINEYFYWVMACGWYDKLEYETYCKFKDAGFDTLLADSKQAAIIHYIKC